MKYFLAIFILIGLVGCKDDDNKGYGGIATRGILERDFIGLLARYETVNNAGENPVITQTRDTLEIIEDGTFIWTGIVGDFSNSNSEKFVIPPTEGVWSIESKVNTINMFAEATIINEMNDTMKYSFIIDNAQVYFESSKNHTYKSDSISHNISVIFQ
ncbi:hypothetical protein OAQ99_06015 [Candidatus Kapabacteria bacterium]|nr:hypothetical protein [Candidatus Kapabacteria bacterium]